MQNCKNYNICKMTNNWKYAKLQNANLQNVNLQKMQICEIAKMPNIQNYKNCKYAKL